MGDDKYHGPMESFPVVQLVTSFALWLLPPIVATTIIFFSIQTPRIPSILVLLTLVVAVPLAGYLLYKLDWYKNDGYVSIWGYR